MFALHGSRPADADRVAHGSRDGARSSRTRLAASQLPSHDTASCATTRFVATVLMAAVSVAITFLLM